MKPRTRYTRLARSIPGLEDAIDAERLYFRTEPGAEGGTAPAGGTGGEGGGTEDQPAGGGEGSGSGAPAGGGEGGGAAGGSGGGGDEFDKERAMATIKRQRAEEEKAKADLKAERELREKLEREKMSEEEKKAADAAKVASENEALKRQVRSAELLGRLANRSDVADAEIARDMLLQRGLQFGDDGKPVDLDTAVTNLLEEKPLLRKGEAPAPGGDGAGSGGGGGGGTGEGGSGTSAPTPPAGNGAAGSGGQGSPPQLTADEVKAANEAGLSTEKYAALRDSARKSGGKVSLEDWQKTQEQPAPTT